MNLGIPCTIKNVEYSLQINTQVITLTPIQIDVKQVEKNETTRNKDELKNKSNDENIIILPFVSLKSIQIKNVDENFLLRVTLTNMNIVIGFRSHIDRDIIKSLILFIEKEIMEGNSIDLGNEDLKTDLKKYGINDDTSASLLQEHKVIYNREMKITDLNSKNDLFLILLRSPILLTVFSLIQSTPKQFFNLLRLSYFFDNSNSKNVIDRRIQELTHTELDFANRINYQSQEVPSFEIISKPLVEKEIQFKPIYPHHVIGEERKNQFQMPVIQKLEVDLDVQKEINENRNEFFKGNFIKIASFIYQNRNNMEKRKELEMLIKNVEENMNITDRKVFERVLPSFFLKK